MGSILIVLVLAGGPEAAEKTYPDTKTAVKELQGTLQTGSLIFSRGDCLAVRIFSQSRYTHVGGVVVTGNTIVVYDSMNGTGVRKTPLDEYLKLQSPSELHVVHPARPFSVRQATAFASHLESQVGRPYAVRHHLTGERCDGLHCSEYMTDALIAADLIHANQPARVSPGSLLEGLEQGKLCADGGCISLHEVSSPVPADLTWCQRTWRSTVGCCTRCGKQLQRWILCR